MGAIAHVRCDEDKIRQNTRSNICLQIIKRNDALVTTRRIEANRIEINERIMLLTVIHCAADETWLGHILLIRFPCTTAVFNQIWQTGNVYKTISAVRTDAKCVSADHRNVIRQAGMGYGVKLSQQSVVIGKPVEGWHSRVADHRAEFFVLEDQNYNMVKIWESAVLVWLSRSR